MRLVVTLDAKTGAKLWEKVVDLTGSCGDYMGAAYSDGLLLFYGNHGNHDAWRFREGGMQWRRITALAAQTGEMVWSRPLNYRTRPVIVGDKIILEPQACYLHTGEIVMRDHPVTGQQVPWEFLRPGHTCGITAASASGLFYRSACTALYDIGARQRGDHFRWLSTGLRNQRDSRLRSAALPRGVCGMYLLLSDTMFAGQ